MDAKRGMCKLKGGMDKGGHYDVEMKGWMQKGSIISKLMDNGRACANEKGGWKRWHYDVQIKRADG